MLLSLVLCYYAPTMAQEIRVLDLSDRTEMNYYFARIEHNTTNSKWLYNGGLNINIFLMIDDRATPIEFLEDFVSSYIISVTPDGDYYSWSKLFKIEGLYNPKILEIKEKEYAPYFTITIEYGDYNQREEKVFTLKGED